VDQAFAEEYLGLLVKTERYKEAWDFYQTIPAVLQCKDRISLTAGLAAVECGQLDFAESLFDRTFAVIREGENSTSNMWFRWKARKLAEERGVPYSEDLLLEAQLNYLPPANLDFRMFAAQEKKILEKEAETK